MLGEGMINWMEERKEDLVGAGEGWILAYSFYGVFPFGGYCYIGGKVEVWECTESH